jgi:hypothetical protein
MRQLLGLVILRVRERHVEIMAGQSLVVVPWCPQAMERNGGRKAVLVSQEDPRRPSSCKDRL